MKKVLMTILIFLLACGNLYASEKSGAEWLKYAQLGKFAPKVQDWKAIEAAAKKEGKVVIYSLSSRIFKIVDEFKKKYGIEIVAFDLPSDVQLERFKREHRANRFTVDVIYNREVPMLIKEFIPKNLVWNFVPSTVESFLDDNEKEPMLIQRWSSRVVFYNSNRNAAGSPIDSFWDLTRNEWKGNVLLLDPLSSSFDANMIQTILSNPEAMKAAYEKEFGKPVTFSKKLIKAVKELGLEPDASKEWLFRLLQNDTVFLGSTSKVYKNVGDVTQKAPPVGITTFSKSRQFKKGVHEALPAYNLDPIVGVASPTVLVIADHAPNPNAAKLLIRYMMEKGFWPWNEPGDYAARSDVEKEQVKKFNVPAFNDLKVWKVDPDYVYDTKFEFLNLFINLR